MAVDALPKAAALWDVSPRVADEALPKAAALWDLSPRVAVDVLGKPRLKVSPRVAVDVLGKPRSKESPSVAVDVAATGLSTLVIASLKAAALWASFLLPSCCWVQSKV